MTAFAIKHERFEGPLDLLLDLIERRQLHIGDVALAKVADDFIVYTKNFSDFPLAEGAQFALVCATLLLLKSKSLLPGLELTEEEQGGIEDLQERLRLLERFRALARLLAKRGGSAAMHAPKGRTVSPLFLPPAGFSISALLTHMKAVIAALPTGEKLASVVVKKAISLEEVIENLRARVARALKMSFRDFAGGAKAERVTVIVSFLALLELMKQGIVAAVQNERHGEILMETEELGTPRY